MYKVLNCEAAKELEATLPVYEVLHLMEYIFKVDKISGWTLPKKNFLELFHCDPVLLKWGWSIKEEGENINFIYRTSKDVEQIDYYEKTLISLIYTLIILNYAETDTRNVELYEYTESEDDLRIILSCFKELGYACEDFKVALRKEDLK